MSKDTEAAINANHEEAAMRRVSLYFDGDQEWTFIDHRDEPAPDDADDEDHRFVVEVPQHLVDALADAEAAEMAARRAIFDHVGFEQDLGEFVEPCDAWIGDEPLPRKPFWEVHYRASGSEDEWPARDDARLTAFDSEAEAEALIRSLPDEFVMHHFGARLQTLRRDRLFIKHHEGWRGHRSNCHRCGHDFADHPGHSGHRIAPGEPSDDGSSRGVES